MTTLPHLRMPFPPTPGATRTRATIPATGPRGHITTWPHPGTTTVEVRRA